jgi:LmbE family N-acetylglucosaminyl deacetylase
MRRVLAVGAHPDDIELGCGGTLAAHRSAGDAVTMLVLTRGQNGPGEPELRSREQERAAAALGAELVWGWQADCAVTADAVLVAAVEDVIERLDADVVYVHGPQDTHQDHRAAAAAVLSAARHTRRVLHYRSPSSTAFEPTLFVDIATHLDTKLDAVGCHRSQVEGSAMVEPDVVVASARHYGAQARIRYAEPFAVARFVWDLAPAQAGSAGSVALAAVPELAGPRELGQPVGAASWPAPAA